MTVVALLSVAPVREGSMAEDVAAAVAALDDFDVTYETNPMGTVIEAEDVTPHALRQSVAWRMINAEEGHTLYDVRNRLHHRSIQTTERVVLPPCGYSERRCGFRGEARLTRTSPLDSPTLV